MKKSAVLAGLMAFSLILLVSCGNQIESINAQTEVTIKRMMPLLDIKPYIRIACESANFDAKKRTITIEGLVSFAGSQSHHYWTVEKMEIVNGKLIIFIPQSQTYDIKIGPWQYRLMWEPK
jgi:hypothetical protein